MTAALGRLLPVSAGLLLGLTYLLLRAATPDAVLHERTLDALDALTFHDAALQRDALKVRAGILRDYDPLVAGVEGLRRATASLGAAGAAHRGEAGLEIGRQLSRLSGEVAAQEVLVESLKSGNALVQNSLTYFAHATRTLTGLPEAARTAAPVEVGALANAMLRFTREPTAAGAAEVGALLERPTWLPPAPGLDHQEVRTLLVHGRLIVARLPEVDAVLGRLLRSPIAAHVAGLQGTYLGLHREAEARAATFRVLLYAAAVALLAYLSYLFLRLRANASALRGRLAFERLIAGISAQFINLPPERVDGAIDEGLARLGEHAGADRAYILLPEDAGPGEVAAAYGWRRADAAPSGPPVLPPGGAATLHVPQVAALPPGPLKASLERGGIRSWLCFTIGAGDLRVGFLGLDAVRRERRWSEGDIALLRTAGGILATALERKRGEEERRALEAQLRRSQRMETIGTLAGGIAHDFNNILAAIMGYGEMALAALPPDARARRPVERVMRAGERARGVVDQILSLGRADRREPRPLRLGPVVEEAVELLRTARPGPVTLATRLTAGAAVVVGDPARLHQLVLNLCTNAAQAMEGRGTVRVELDAIELGEDLVLSHGTVAAGPCVRLAVSDSGRGIDEAARASIFDPLFTTRATRGGVGLGLATVRAVVEEHGGALDVRSAVGQGTTFAVYLPRAAAPAVSPAPDHAPLARGHGQTILLVDDERSLVLLAEEMLAALGYEPVGFEDAARALAAFRADPARFDLVLTDELMPEMSGTELAQAAHALRPELPVVLMTGHAARVRPDRLRAAGIREVLGKPLLARDIALSLARQLGQPR